MRKFGLIGFPLGHSFSKKYFEEKFENEKIADCVYENFELKSIDEFPLLLKSNTDLAGLNFTIPYKEAVIPFLNSISDEAKKIGAVNCVKVIDGKTEGFNTDAIAFEKSLKKFIDGNSFDSIFILGTGGSSNAAFSILQKMNLPCLRVSRKKYQNFIIDYSGISVLMGKQNLFINCTPLGMFPNEDSSPEIPYEKLSERDFLFDLIYNPSETLFLKKGTEHGAKTKNGLEMLYLQAEESWKIWNS